MEKSPRSKTQKQKLASQKTSWTYEYSAGGVVCKKVRNGNFLFLIIQPKDTNRWQLPKGHIDEGESSRNAAVRKVQEEGGVVALAQVKLGDQKYFFQIKGKKIIKTVTFFLMEYIEDTKEGFDPKEVEQTGFVSFDKSQELLSFNNDREMVKKAYEILSRGMQESLV